MRYGLAFILGLGFMFWLNPVTTDAHMFNTIEIESLTQRVKALESDVQRLHKEVEELDTRLQDDFAMHQRRLEALEVSSRGLAHEITELRNQ